VSFVVWYVFLLYLLLYFLYIQLKWIVDVGTCVAERIQNAGGANRRYNGCIQKGTESFCRWVTQAQSVCYLLDTGCKLCWMASAMYISFWPTRCRFGKFFGCRLACCRKDTNCSSADILVILYVSKRKTGVFWQLAHCFISHLPKFGNYVFNHTTYICSCSFLLFVVLNSQFFIC